MRGAYLQANAKAVWMASRGGLGKWSTIAVLVVSAILIVAILFVML